MEYYVIIGLCALIVISYIFDISAKITRIPSVFFSLLLGIGLRFIGDKLGYDLPNIKNFLAILGTVGLILIVLEGSLDLELEKGKYRLIRNSFLSAITLLIVCGVIFAMGLSWLTDSSFVDALVNVTPLCIISSAIAIPGTSILGKRKREFVTYESSFSDILGILFFNFFAFNDYIDAASVGTFFLNTFVTLIVSVFACIVVGYLLHRITHHIKFIFIIAIIVLIYTVAKVYHLPSLILILIFGLFFNNMHLIAGTKMTRFLDPKEIDEEVIPFKYLVSEVTFVVRSFFFILFGYYTKLSDLFNIEELMMAIGIVAFGLLVRALIFKMLVKLDWNPLLFISPRGLITILLFLSIPASKKIPIINEGLLTQVIFLSAFVMMFGLFITNKEKEKASEVHHIQ